MDTATVRELPMFPLGSVLFPHALLPLHVFEQRYRALLRDIMDADREFGVVLIEAGHEVGGGDRRSNLGTLAKVVEAEEFDDGRWGVVGVGTQRLRVQEWLPDDPYPRALVRIVEDPTPDDAASVLRAEVVATLRRVLALASELGADVPEATTELADDPTVASYHVSALAPLGPLDRQKLLEADDATSRLAMARGLLDEVADDLRLRLEVEAAPPDGSQEP